MNMVKYYLTIKRDDALIHGTIWMNLIDIWLSERVQSPKNPHIE